MSLIKDNKFMAALGGGTLLGVILLYFVGSHGATKYNDAKTEFETASGDAAGFERLALYPKKENKDAKAKALDEYRRTVEGLQTSFKPFRPEPFVNTTPQVFTNNLLAAEKEIRAAFEEAGATVPEAFFAGFERYKTSLASDAATGVLTYQLGAIKNVLLALAKAHPTELKNLYRPALPEEEGKPYVPVVTDVARAYPLELSFVGSEKSVREFFSAITKTEGQFITIRAVRITNEKKDPPRSADAQFEKPAAAAKPAADTGGAFGGFVLPGDDAAPAAPETPAAPAAPSTKPADSGKILAQVLGEEKIQVFVRLDILQFLPEKKLP